MRYYEGRLRINFVAIAYKDYRRHFYWVDERRRYGYDIFCFFFCYLRDSYRGFMLLVLFIITESKNK